MRRGWRTILLFLALGAIANFAVAWAAAVLVNPWVTRPPLIAFGPADSPGRRLAQLRHCAGATAVALYVPPADAPVTYEYRPSAIPYWSDLSEPGGAQRALVERRIEDARGWPMRSLMSVTTCSKGIHGRTGQRIWVLSWGIELDAPPQNVSMVRALPCQPILFGSLVNTLFYAVVLWLLIRGPFALRRAIRLKKRRCPACGYPFGESPVCTECGHDIERWIAKGA